MSGAIPLLPLHTLMAWTGTSSHYLTFTVPLVWWKLLLRSPVTFTFILKMKLEISPKQAARPHSATFQKTVIFQSSLQ